MDGIGMFKYKNSANRQAGRMLGFEINNKLKNKQIRIKKRI